MMSPKLVLSEPNPMKDEIIAQGNQKTFHLHPELVRSHMLAIKFWVLLYSPFAQSTAQVIQIKLGKNTRIIWENFTKM
jgi:hypothetical protein